MTKSEVYRLAQVCVLRDEHIAEARKLEILRILIQQEDLALYTEQKEKTE